jgi:hypothetical protein
MPVIEITSDFVSPRKHGQHAANGRCSLDGNGSVGLPVLRRVSLSHIDVVTHFAVVDVLMKHGTSALAISA